MRSFVVVPLLALAAGCGGGSSGGAATPSTLRLDLKIGSVVAAKPSCAATPVERGRATTVVVTDASGTQLVAGRTSAGTSPVQTTTAFGSGIFSEGCLFSYTAEVPARDSYHVVVSGKYAFDVPRSMVEQPDLRLFIEYRQGLLVAFPPTNGLLPPG